MTDHSHPRHGRRDDSTTPAPSPDADTRQVERERDRIVTLLGARALADIDAEDVRDARFLDWWAVELRNRASTAEHTAAAERFETRMRAAVAAREHRVQLVEGMVPRRPPRIDGTVASVILGATAARCAPSLDLGVAAGVGRDLWDEPCTSWVELPESVPDGQHVALTVTGESMEPLLHAGDTILVKLGAALRRGAIVVARRPDDGYVVKRVSRIGPRVIELASLHAGYGAIRIPRRDDLILGTVIMRWSVHPQRA
jgi:SOS-response transcriptional repressor LexA